MISSISFVICEMMLFIEVLMTRIDNHSCNVRYFFKWQEEVIDRNVRGLQDRDSR